MIQLFFVLILFINPFNLNAEKFRRGEAKLQQVLGHGKLDRKEWDSHHKHHHQDSSWVDIVNNPYFVMGATYVANKLLFPMIDPFIDSVSNNCYNLYYTYWLTPEEQEELQKKQQEKDLQLLEDYNKALMKREIIFVQTERGQRILMREKEQEQRLAEHALKENDLLLEHKSDVLLEQVSRDNFAQEIALLRELKQETSDLETKKVLQQKLDDKIRNWANSR